MPPTTVQGDDGVDVFTKLYFFHFCDITLTRQCACCKDDQQSQWEMLNIDPAVPQPTQNRLSDRHQIWRS